MLLGIVVFASAQVAGPDEMMKGIEFTRASSVYPYNSGSARQALERLAATGANWVTIVPVWWMSDTGASNIFWMLDQSPSDAEVRQAVRWARQLGLEVFMKPEVHCLSGVWQGHHDPHDEVWFYSYSSFIRHFAELAQEETCAMFCAGAELDKSADEPWERDQWLAIIGYVKSKFLGPVTYAADWRTYPSIPFWDAVDVIGINAYFPLSDDAVPHPLSDTVKYLAGVWKNRWIPEIEGFRNAHNWADTVKPIILTELGYRSIEGCYRYPWDEQIAAPCDGRMQRHCYIAGLHSLLGRPWFAGWFWHEWTTDPDQGGTEDLSYSPKGKPAQEVLRRWFAAVGTQRGISMAADRHHSDIYEWPRTELAVESLARTWAEWVTIVPVGWMDSIGSDGIRVINATTYPASPSDHALGQVMAWAESAGLKVVLKPHVDCINGDFRGNHDPKGAGVLEDWFEDYRVFITTYARMAESANCELFCIGTELNHAVDDGQEIALWRSSIIPAVRQAYSGPITFTALCTFLNDPPDDDTVLPDLWTDLDFIGVDAYFQLFPKELYPSYGDVRDTFDGQRPNVYDLVEGADPYNPLAWQQKWLPRLGSLSDLVDKPVIFPEIGYRSIDSSAWLGGGCQRYGWDSLYSGTTADLYAVCFPMDTLIGYVVGAGGAILKTTNSGGLWVSRSSGTSCDLYALSFPRQNAGYAVGADGTILKTEDGWENRTKKAIDGQHAAYRGVCFPFDPDTGYVVGDGGIALRTSNGGDNWSTMSVGTTAGLRSVDFPCRDTGFIVGDSGIVLRTTDAGSTWTRCNSPSGWTLRSVHFRSPDTGYVVGDSGTCLYTQDAGETWLDNSLRHSRQTLRAVTVPALRPKYDTSAYVVGDEAAILRVVSFDDAWEIDGMRQWYPVYRNYNDICFPDSLTGFIVGDSGTILKTTRGGRMRIDYNEQRNCYEAAFRAFWSSRDDLRPSPWFYGFHWWGWETEPTPRERQNGLWVDAFTPQQKPAQTVLTQWYSTRPVDPGPNGHHVRHYPTGSLDVVVPENGRVNVPLVLFRLESRSWEGGGPADQARLIQEYCGRGDTILKLDSTAWFNLGQQTTFNTEWRFLSGEGKYRFYVQFLDLPDKLSPPYPDFEDTVVVFDTTAAEGSITLNGGDRFATSQTCSLAYAASDMVSGVRATRLGRAELVNLVANPSFTAQDGGWEFFPGGRYRTSLDIACRVYGVGLTGFSFLIQQA